MLLAPSKVCMYLSWEQRVLGYVGLSRILVEREEKEPNDSDDDTDQRHEWS